MTISTINRKLGLALMAGALVVSAFAPLSALAADGEYGGYDYFGGGYDYGTTDYYGGGYDSGTTDYYGGGYDSGATDYYGGGYDSGATDYYGGGYDYGTTDYYGGGYDSTTADYGSSYSTPSYTAPSFGGSSYSSMPSFGGSSYASAPIYTSAANQQYRYEVATQLPTFVQPNVSNACTAVNSCNSDNSYHYTDNSVYAPNNSYTNTVTDNSVYSAPTTVTVTTDSHNQQISYPQPTYQAPTFQPPVYQSQYQYQAQYQQPTYQPTCYTNCYPMQRPVAYNTTPYITLSQAPYTGLDLGPVGEVLYWSFLVLWCLAAAYLIVVKRVQNKLVSFLNGFLFGSSTKTVAHTTHAASAPVAAKAALVEEGIDPFIQSQIKRA